jgi:hypothetical protein
MLDQDMYIYHLSFFNGLVEHLLSEVIIEFPDTVIVRFLFLVRFHNFSKDHQK